MILPQLTVLSQAQRGGDFGELCTRGGGSFDGAGNCSDSSAQLVDPANGDNPYPFNRVPVNPVSANYIAKYVPLPTPGLNDPNGFISSSGNAIDEEQGILRIDHTLTNRDNLSFLYVVNDVRDFFPFDLHVLSSF